MVFFKGVFRHCQGARARAASAWSWGDPGPGKGAVRGGADASRPHAGHQASGASAVISALAQVALAATCSCRYCTLTAARGGLFSPGVLRAAIGTVPRSLLPDDARATRFCVTPQKDDPGLLAVGDRIAATPRCRGAYAALQPGPLSHPCGRFSGHPMRASGQ